MPYFSIETNKQIDNKANEELMKKASVFLSEMLGKPEQVIMVTIKSGMPYIFGGTNDPAAFVQVKSLGLETDRCSEFSDKVCVFLEEEADVPRDRAFIEFIDIDGKIFGWNGRTLVN
ncbi:phenylpyruvate tautomerase MIF-related protein [Thermodesulfobacteriota bacterium]